MSELPDGWAETSISVLFTFKYGKGLPQERRNSSGEVSVYGSNGVVGKHDESITNGVTIIVGRKGSVGEVNVSPEPCWPIDTTYYIDEFHCQIPADYWALFFKSLRLGQQDKSSAIPGINRDDIYQLNVPVPPLNEQRRIVAMLEKLLGKVNACQQRLENIPRILKRFRQAVLAAACSGRLTMDRRNNSELSAFNIPVQIGYPETEELPSEWRRVFLVDFAKLESGHTPRKTIAEYWDNGDVPWISLQDIRQAHGRVIRETKLMPTMLGIENSSARLLPKGTVCFSRDISLGYVTVMGREMATTQHFANWLCGSKIHNLYLMYALMASREYLIASGQGSTVGTIYMPELKQFTIALPPLAEQVAIVGRIAALFKLADQLETRYQKAKAHVDVLQQSILAKAFRGELVPQDPNDEPASVLLERIGAERAGDVANGNQRKRKPATVMEQKRSTRNRTAKTPKLFD